MRILMLFLSFSVCWRLRSVDPTCRKTREEAEGLLRMLGNRESLCWTPWHRDDRPWTNRQQAMREGRQLCMPRLLYYFSQCQEKDCRMKNCLQ